MTHKEEGLYALDRALGLIAKDGPMTALDTSLVRSALLHAATAVGKIEELKKARPKPKATKVVGDRNFADKVPA